MNTQGSSPLLMVMLLLLTGGLVLQISDKLLTAGTARIGDEYLYMQAFSEAQSSLARGLRQRWKRVSGWQCQPQPPPGGTGCLYWQSAEVGVLRGQSSDGQVVVWRRVQPSPSGSGGSSDPSAIGIEAIPRGWSDLCPLADERDCYPDRVWIQSGGVLDRPDDPVVKYGATGAVSSPADQQRPATMGTA